MRVPLVLMVVPVLRAPLVPPVVWVDLNLALSWRRKAKRVSRVLPGVQVATVKTDVQAFGVCKVFQVTKAPEALRAPQDPLALRPSAPLAAGMGSWWLEDPLVCRGNLDLLEKGAHVVYPALAKKVLGAERVRRVCPARQARRVWVSPGPKVPLVPLGMVETSTSLVVVALALRVPLVPRDVLLQAWASLSAVVRWCSPTWTRCSKCRTTCPWVPWPM